MTEVLTPLQKEIVDTITSDTYILTDYMGSKKQYTEFIDNFYEFMKHGFEITEFRKAPVKFRLRQGSPEHTVRFQEFIIILKFLAPFVWIDEVDDIDECHIVDPNILSDEYIQNFINSYLVPMIDYNKISKVNSIICDLLFSLSPISADFMPIIGTTISLYGFMDMANDSEEFNDIIHTKLDTSLQPSEIESLLTEKRKQQMRIIREHPHWELYPLIQSSSIIKDKQLAEVTISGGLKPGVGGDTIATPINSNLLVGGYKSVKDYFVDAKGGRKPYILNNSAMGTAGYFANKCILLASDIQLSKSNIGCNSVNLLPTEIKTMGHFKRLIGRSYEGAYGRLRTVRKKDVHLIGTTIYIKSPITCNHKYGEICPECYGKKLYKINRNIMVGAYAAAITMNPVSQRILSSKHILTTDSGDIGPDKAEFFDFFYIDSNEICIRDDLDTIDEWHLVVNHDDLIEVDDTDGSDVSQYVDRIVLQNTKTGERVEFEESTKKPLYISPELEEILDDMPRMPEYMIPLSKLVSEDGSGLFVVSIENNELTKPLYDIMEILDIGKKRKEFGITTIEQLHQKMLDLSVDSNINVMSVHTEIMLYGLVRSSQDILKRPNFARTVLPGMYELLTVKKALEKHPSPLIGLSYEQIPRQLIHPDTYRKHSTSFVDPFFKEFL